MNELRLFFSYALQHKYSYLLGVICLFITNLLAVTIPVYLGESVDLLDGNETSDYESLIEKIYWVIGFAFCVMLSRTASRMLFFNPGRLVEKDFKNDAFKTLTQSQQHFYGKHPVGGLISIVNNDINGIRAMAGVGMMNVFNIFFTLSMTPIKMWQISPSLMLYCLAPVLVSFLIVNYAIATMRKLLSQRMRYLQNLSTQTVTFLNGVEVIKGNAIQPWALAKFNRSNDDILEVSLKQLRIRTFIMPILEFTESVLKIIILGVGGWYLVQSELSLGDITAFLAYASLLAMPFMSLGRLISTVQMGMVSLKSMGRILNQTIIDENTLSPSEKASFDQHMLFSKGLSVRNLNFAYPKSMDGNSDKISENNADKNNGFALKNLSFDIKPGEKVAILGRVGSGKTTLVNCLNRFYETPENSIFIDGYDVTQLSRKELRSVIRTITQEPFLFSDTLENNIRFGSEAAKTRLTMDMALAQSAMKKDVKTFPDGVQTLVGEKGILLSGGQKQRISLARGLFTPANLLVLDNVLSAVDNDTERFLLDQIFNHAQAKSCLIVSHRQAVLERVDNILLLEKGEIIATGSHEELLKTSNLYRETWQFLQTGALEEEKNV
ncbi:ABC transporter ATP-binding protein [Marinomonas sp. 15G1-11]|uniref:ABC transporter ATP-binding protein n=1 Tax=Marinomonas phaeophyticola TaxID=3004091 RepID=A0ABT4JY45_9GAMM|nr:ABC transporter ATP-binding protein [Marinomonas sp. 15G1-11]MCZ2723151.1 ABC transporter ATP-binding protein [Marinomonas sp. 15G1-11]